MSASLPPESGPAAPAASVDKYADKPVGKAGDKGGKENDDLLDCLVFLTRHYGRARSADSIRAGLPYDEKGMGPQLFCEAAQRMGLKARVVKRSDPLTIPAPVLPAILMMKDGRAAILLSVGEAGGEVRLYMPESGREVRVKKDKAFSHYSGYAIFVHPDVTFTDPDAPHKQDAGRHWFWGPMVDNLGLYGRVGLAAALIGLFGLTGPLFIMNVYDRVIPNNALETGWVLAIGALTIFAFDFIMRTLRGYFIDLAGRRVDVIVSRRIYDQLLDMKLAGRPNSAGAFANMLREFETIRDFITSASLTVLVDLPFAFLYMSVIWLIGGPVALMLLCLILIVIGAGMALQYPLKRVVRKATYSSENKHGLLVETIQALETIKAVGADGRMRARYGAHVGESALYGQRSRFLSALGVNIAMLLQQSASIIIVLMGMYLVRDQVMTMGGLIACVLLGSRAIAPIGQLANILSRWHQSSVSMKTLEKLMEKPVERPADKNFLHRPSLSGKLTMDKVSFSYPGARRLVLDEVSFTIRPGERVGLIGRIGSGKSTVARLLLGLYDADSGALFADDTDYRQIDPADLRRNMAYIAQDVVLFRGTVRENIIIGQPKASEDDILNAAKNAGVHEFVSRHPMGYDAPVGERGEGLSGGQRQAIALARAMLSHPNIIICDEPTNAMDMQAEQAFVRHIQEQSRDKTLVLITHRQHLLGLVDRLILLDQGRVIADGARDAVMEALARGVQVPENGRIAGQGDA